MDKLKYSRVMECYIAIQTNALALNHQHKYTSKM